MRAFLLALLGTILFVGPLFAQSYGNRVWKSLDVRQSADVKSMVAMPAMLQITIPENDTLASTYVVNAAIMATVIPLSKFSGDAVVEWHRNTAIAKEQDVFRSGLTWNWKPWGESFVPIIGGELLYKRDRVADTRSAIASLIVSATGVGGKGLPNTTIELAPSPIVTLVYSPAVGVEAEEQSDKQFVRGLLRFDAVIRLGEPTTPVLELTSANTWRFDWEDQSAPGQESTGIHNYALNLFFVRTDRLLGGLGVSYTRGADPSVGFQEQEYTQIGVVFLVKQAI